MLLLIVPKDRDPDLGATLDPAAQQSDVQFDLGSLELVDERPAHALSDDRRGTKLVAGAIAGGAATLLLMVAMVRSGSNDPEEQGASPTTELARPSVQEDPVRDIDAPPALAPAPVPAVGEITPAAVVAAAPPEPTPASEVAPGSAPEIDALARVSLSDASSPTHEVPVATSEAAATEEPSSAEPAFAGLPSIADDEEFEPGKPMDLAEAGVDPEPPDEPRHESTTEIPAEPSVDQDREPQGVTAFAPDETPATADEPQV
jgi:hypothetical protein